MTAPCPTCATPGFANPGELAAHLIDAHLMAGIPALTRARTAFPNEEVPVAKNEDRTGECPECHCLRHAKTCSQHFRSRGKTLTAPPAGAKKTTGRCGYCKHERPDHSENCRLNGTVGAKKRKPITRRDPGPLAKAENSDLVSEIAALGAVAEALTALDLDGRMNVLGCVCKLLAIDPTKLAA